MARDLDTDLQTLNTVLAFAQNRDFERAAALAEKTLASGFEHPLLLNVLATRLEQEGKFEESLRLLERAVAIAPGDMGARNALSIVPAAPQSACGSAGSRRQAPEKASRIWALPMPTRATR